MAVTVDSGQTVAVNILTMGDGSAAILAQSIGGGGGDGGISGSLGLAADGAASVSVGGGGILTAL